MRNPLLAPELRELLQEERHEDLVSVLSDMHPNDAASILSGLETDEVVQVMALLPMELERDVFEYLDPEVQGQIVVGSGRGQVKDLLARMASDDRAAFLDLLDERVRTQLFPLLSNAAREDLLRRDRFEDDQVGNILSTEYCVLGRQLTAKQAIEELRRQAPRKETIYYSYVVDGIGKLLGFVSLRNLIMAPDDALLGDIMKDQVVSIRADADQEEAAKLIHEYDLIALPVVDDQGYLVGIVTHDDAADIVLEEDTEDIEKMAGIAGEPEVEGGYLEESVLSQFRRRAPVITFLAMFFLGTAFVIGAHKGSLDGGPKFLLALLPMVMATGGMVGGQAATLIIRALTTGDLEPKALRVVLWKEVRVCVSLAAVLSAVVFAEAFVLGMNESYTLGELAQYGGVLALAMAAHVVTAGALGAVIPLLVKRVKGDPANISTPAVTAVADFTGAAIYLTLVALLLPKLGGA